MIGFVFAEEQLAAFDASDAVAAAVDADPARSGRSRSTRICSRLGAALPWRVRWALCGPTHDP
jgi:hypothetical protein